MSLTIDNKKIKFDKQMTLLDVAKQNDIYIPNLCAHPELTPYGGCRMCLVEIEGRRGYPTACTTMAEDGLVVRTNTQTLQEMRREMIQLILSEHPSACLLCDDIDGCTGYQETIRKVGVTTGCRWCPKDKDCELQKIVEALNIKELTLPGLYRNIPLEKYDPFFDRDYNLCIYCGRCVRICNEHRMSSVLSLKQRGKLTTIGPAFNLTHIDAGCEFCGACVSVCPTGAMSEKSRKWWGVPAKYQESVCPLCSLNCDIQVLTLKDKIVGTLPPGNPHEAGGELCVKGRFCLTELVNRTERILEPQYRYPEGSGIVSWDFALKKAGEVINRAMPNSSAVLLSPSLTLEEISAAKIFAEKVLLTSDISSSCLDDNLISYTSLSQKSIGINEIKNYDAIVSFYFDGNYNFAPITLAVKHAASTGMPYYQIGYQNDTTTRFAAKHIIPLPGKELKFFQEILNSIKQEKFGTNDTKSIAKLLSSTKKSLIIIGPEILSLSNCSEILSLLSDIVKNSKSSVVMPNGYANLNGLLSIIKMKSFADVKQKIDDGKIDLLYLIGDAPFTERPNVKIIFYQSAFPVPPGLDPDFILPNTVWGETGGTYINSNGGIKKFKPAAVPHGYARTTIDILAKLSKAAKAEGVKFSAKEIDNEIPQNPKMLKPSSRQYVKSNEKPISLSDDFPILLSQSKAAHTYYGLNLALGLEGLNDLVKPNNILINKSDARKLEITDGDYVKVKSREKESQYKAVVRKNIPTGLLQISTSNGKMEFESNPCPVNIRRDNV